MERPELYVLLCADLPKRRLAVFEVGCTSQDRLHFYKKVPSMSGCSH